MQGLTLVIFQKVPNWNNDGPLCPRGIPRDLWLCFLWCLIVAQSPSCALVCGFPITINKRKHTSSHTHTCILTHANTHPHTCKHAYSHTQTRTLTQTNTHTHTRKHAHSHTQTRILTHANTHPYTRKHAYSHMYMHHICLVCRSLHLQYMNAAVQG